jgi:hypothetical protein
VGLGNVLHTGLLGALGKVLDGLVGSEVARRAELADGCPAAAAGTLTLASRRLAPSNKRNEVLLGTLVDLGAARACGERRPGVEFTAVVLWRTAAARSPWRHARRRLGSIYKRSCLGEGVHDHTHARQGSRHGHRGQHGEAEYGANAIGRAAQVGAASLHA